jgi:uncharacterized protein (TIGR00725 family)
MTIHLASSKVYVAVVGGGEADKNILEQAYEVGREIAFRGAIVICGGLGGVMQAAAKGACEAGGTTIGILPGPDRRAANSYLTFSVVTNLGHVRNMIIAHSADAMIAVDGSYGTISEAAIALKLGKTVVGLGTEWDLAGMKKASSVKEAIDFIFKKHF